MTTKPAYAPPGSVGIPNLDPFFGPDAPPLPDAEPPDDLMLQNPDIHYALQILYDVVVGDRADVFIDTNSIVYYDPSNRNRRVQPDVYIAFDVDADTIRHRNGYVIWEVGKPPDFVLEVASESTADNDTGYKRDLYARLGVREYWRFDRTGGELYGAGLAGEYLENGDLSAGYHQYRCRRGGMGIQPSTAPQPASARREAGIAGSGHWRSVDRPPGAATGPGSGRGRARRRSRRTGPLLPLTRTIRNDPPTARTSGHELGQSTE